MDAAALASASAKVRRHLLPFLVLCYFTAYLDRVNIGFAALTMNADLGIGPEAFGFVAGIFFAGYCLAEVPSNIALARFGARVWIARIMISWGLLSMATAFVEGAPSLAVARFLLGLAEAGFFPGIIYYLTQWVPEAERARTVSAFMVAVPVSSVIGAPLSGWLLDATNGWMGIKGWQWLFILEALPAVVLGFAALFVLRDRPEDAPWLSARKPACSPKRLPPRTRLEPRKVVHAAPGAHRRKRPCHEFSFISASSAGSTASPLAPQIVKAFGLTNTQTGLVAALPPLAGALVMVPWGRHSDRTGDGAGTSHCRHSSAVRVCSPERLPRRPHCRLSP